MNLLLIRLIRLGMTAVLASGSLALAATPSQAQEATTIECADVFPDLGGTIAFTPGGDLLGNCWRHTQGTTGSVGVPARIVSCDEALGSGAIGIEVHTANGGTYTNCHIHAR